MGVGVDVEDMRGYGMLRLSGSGAPPVARACLVTQLMRGLEVGVEGELPPELPLR